MADPSGKLGSGRGWQSVRLHAPSRFPKAAPAPIRREVPPERLQSAKDEWARPWGRAVLAGDYPAQRVLPQMKPSSFCRREQVVFELDHVRPRSRGGSDRVSNLVLACHACNEQKGNQTAAEFGHPEVEEDARKPLKDAAAMNATRDALCEALRALDVPITTWSGGRTRWNRDRFGVEKAHCLDALCVGELAGAKSGRHRTLAITAMGRGRYSRTNVNDSGFPTGYLMRTKQIMGIKTGDRVRAVVPAGFAAHGTHTGRIAVRANRQFRLGKVQAFPRVFAGCSNWPTDLTTPSRKQLCMCNWQRRTHLPQSQNACFLPIFEII